MGRGRALGGVARAVGLAILLLAAAAAPTLAADMQPASTAAAPPWPAGPDIDPADPPPWPVNSRGLSIVENVPSRFDRAPLPEVAAAAKAGDAEARAVLERGIRARDARVLAWAEAGAAAAEPEALIALGRILSGDSQDGVPDDPARAARLYRQAADLGSAEAMRRLAGLYGRGLGAPTDLAAQTAWLRRAAEAGDTLAMFALSNRYRNDADPANDAEGELWSRRSAANQITAPPRLAYRVEDLTPAALAGDAAAMRELGTLYGSGLGVITPDPAQAFHWYSRAAERGDPFAMAQLGLLYRDGKGAPRDVAKGLDWLTRSAQAGAPIAMYHLYHTYSDGEGVPADPKAAEVWGYRLFWAREMRLVEPGVGAAGR